MNPVYAPLTPTHPLVAEGHPCPMCSKAFCAGERTTIATVGETELPSTVQGVVVHAHCGFKGVKTPQGVIDSIKDGDASPFPVVTTDGRQWKFEELGLKGK